MRRDRATIELRRLECSSSQLWVDPPVNVWQPRHIRPGRGVGEDDGVHDRDADEWEQVLAKILLILSDLRWSRWVR